MQTARALPRCRRPAAHRRPAGPPARRSLRAIRRTHQPAIDLRSSTCPSSLDCSTGRSPQGHASEHKARRALAASLAAAALAAPSALADDLRSPDARTAAATHAQKRTDVITGGVRAPQWLWPDAAHAMVPVAPTTRVRTPDTPTVVEVSPDRGFDWISAAIGAGGAIALAVIALIGAATLTGRFRAASHRTAPY